MLLTILFAAPLALTLLALACMLAFLPRMWAALEAPYEPSMGDPEAWRAELDVALGEAWWQEPATAVVAPASVVVATPVKRAPKAPSSHVVQARRTRRNGRKVRVEALL